MAVCIKIHCEWKHKLYALALKTNAKTGFCCIQLYIQRWPDEYFKEVLFMEAPGKGLLKVVSILFIIFGAIATIISIFALAGSAWLSNAGVDQTQSVMMAGLGGVLLFGSILLLITSVLELILGIVGFKRSGGGVPA